VTYRVPSLGLPDVDNLPPLESLSQYEAVKLFIDRATAAIPDFKATNENAPALAQICHRLDGIPLAIELAAGKIRVLGLEQIAKRLDDRLKLLTGGSRTAMERHQTLRAAVDWSYNLLPPEEQTLFRRLAIFLGGWTLEAAEAICGENVLELLEQLINKSLVVTEDEGGKIRYRMLETIRQYANEKLVDVGESKALRERHLEFFLDLAETAEPHLYRHEQLEWLAQLDADYENLRAALDHALGAGSTEPSLRLCAALGMFWYIRGYWIEGTQWLAKALGKPADDDVPDEVSARVRALNMDAKIAECLDDFERIRRSAETGLELAQRSGDELEAAIARFHLGYYWQFNGNLREARHLQEESIETFQRLNTVYWEAKSSYRLEEVLYTLGEEKFDVLILQQAEELARQAGERFHLADVLGQHSRVMFSYNQLQDSERLTREADRHLKQVGSAFNRTALSFASLAWIKGEYGRAESLLVEFREQLDVLGEKGTRTHVTQWLGKLALEQHHIQKAREYFEEALEAGRGFKDNVHTTRALALLCNPIFWDGDEQKFRRLAGEGAHLARSTLGYSEKEKRKFLIFLLEAFHVYDPRGTAVILGALKKSEKDGMLESIDQIDKRYVDLADAHSRDVLGEEAFQSALAEGQKMSFGDALDLVLKVLEEEDG